MSRTVRKNQFIPDGLCCTRCRYKVRLKKSEMFFNGSTLLCRRHFEEEQQAFPQFRYNDWK